jgi:hypothetical protein
MQENLNDAGNSVIQQQFSNLTSRTHRPGHRSLYVAIRGIVAELRRNSNRGKTGDALTSLSGSLNGLNFKMQQLGQQLDAIVSGINEAISSIDQSRSHRSRQLMIRCLPIEVVP